MRNSNQWDLSDPTGQLEQWYHQPPEQDVVIRQIYGNPLVAGFLVMSGEHTRTRYQLTPEHFIHFKKSVALERGYFPAREFRTSQTIHRENPLLTPYPIGHEMEEDRIIYRSEYVAGQTLRSKAFPYGLLRTLSDQAPILPHQPESLQDLWSDAAQTLAVTLTLHDLGYVHGDLHLENVIISKESHPVLIDLEATHQPKDPSFFDLDLSNIRVFGKKLLKAAQTVQTTLEENALFALAQGANSTDPVISESPRLHVSQQIDLV